MKKILKVVFVILFFIPMGLTVGFKECYLGAIEWINDKHK
jgi:hypothetical protein